MIWSSTSGSRSTPFRGPNVLGPRASDPLIRLTARLRRRVVRLALLEVRTLTEDIDRDEQALVLRDQGRTYLDIAEILDLDGARAAHAAFNRGLRLRPRAEQGWLRSRELARLDALATRMRGRDDLGVDEVVRHLRALKRQKDSLSVG